MYKFWPKSKTASRQTMGPNLQLRDKFCIIGSFEKVVTIKYEITSQQTSGDIMQATFE